MTDVVFLLQIVMPVNGILHSKGNNAVLVQPTDPEFALLEIVIENIDPQSDLLEKNVKAGDKIGKAVKGKPCQKDSGENLNFIHVSVRPGQTETVADADYDYTDPSPFLDRLVPIPKWIQECNDHEFRYLHSKEHHLQKNN